MTGPLEGVDGPRRMPPELRRRLEEELLAGASLPEGSRTRLTESLSDPTAALLDGVDGPRPMPPRLRNRVEWALDGPTGAAAPAGRAPRRLAAWPGLVAAAVLIVILSSITIVVDRAPDQAATQASDESVSGNAETVLDGASSQGAGTGAGGSAATTGAGLGGPPPFATARFRQSRSALAQRSGGSGADAPSYSSGIGDSTKSSGDVAQPAPFRIALRQGDSAALAGLNAYVDLLNRNGGVRGRRFEFVTGAAAKDADTVVNLSGQPFGDPPGPPSLDDLLAPDAALREDVFSFAGAIERQGRLIADAVFPGRTGATAVVYRAADGPLGSTVPDAIESVLRGRGISTTSVVVRSGRTVEVVRADAVFLSLNAVDAARVTAAYGAAPRLGFNGVGTVADTAGLPDGLRVVSPYDLPSNDETTALIVATDTPLSARLVHGWVAAKTLAMAVWQHDPRTPAEVRAALQKMASFDNGFAPPRQARPGTNSLRPDGIVLQLVAGRFEQRSPFLTDPR